MPEDDEYDYYDYDYRSPYYDYISCPGGTGECIRDTEMCDGTQSCLDWSDEGTDHCPVRSMSDSKFFKIALIRRIANMFRTCISFSLDIRIPVPPFIHQHNLHSALQHAAITNIFVPETIVSIIPAYVTVITTVETGVTNLTAVSVDIMYPKGCKC